MDDAKVETRRGFKLLNQNRKNWIFVINNDYSIFQRRINEKKWLIFSNTHNRKKLRVGDRIVFYKAGRIDGKKFLGSALISTKLKRDRSDFSLGLSNIDVWKETIDIKTFLDKLDFIKDKTIWGSYLQGGIIPISDSDYAIIQTAKKTNEVFQVM